MSMLWPGASARLGPVLAWLLVGLSSTAAFSQQISLLGEVASTVHHAGSRLVRAAPRALVHPVGVGTAAGTYLGTMLLPGAGPGAGERPARALTEGPHGENS